MEGSRSGSVKIIKDPKGPKNYGSYGSRYITLQRRGLEVETKATLYTQGIFLLLFKFRGLNFGWKLS
jgi:hypothetical protein